MPQREPFLKCSVASWCTFDLMLLESKVTHWYREGEGEDFLDEVGGRDGAQHSLDAILLLLHVCLLVKLMEETENGHETPSDDGASPRAVAAVLPSASFPTCCCRRASAPLNTPDERKKTK